MNVVRSIADLPSVPAVYALYGGADSHLFVAYVGIGRSLRQRFNQHLVRQDSSIATGVSAVHLNPNRVVEVRWWEHPDFVRQDVLEATELVAFDVLDPALRSRGGITERALTLYGDAEFTTEMRTLFTGESTGRFVVPTLSVAFQEIAELQKRLLQLEVQHRELLDRLSVRGILPMTEAD